MTTKTLPSAYRRGSKKNGYDMTLINRDANHAVYEVSDTIKGKRVVLGWEVSKTRKKELPATNLWGSERVSEHTHYESLPSDSDFGKTAWFYNRCNGGLKAASNKYGELTNVPKA